MRRKHSNRGRRAVRALLRYNSSDRPTLARDMPDITIRPIDFARDAAPLQSFIEDRDRMRLMHLERACAEGDAFVLVADDGSLPVGWVIVHTHFREDQDWSPPDDDTVAFQSGENAYLENIAVKPRARSNGIGRMLIEAAQEEAKRRGKKYLWLHTAENNVMAHKLFEREGWTHERTVTPEWRPGSRTRIYKKVLA